MTNPERRRMTFRHRIGDALAPVVRAYVRYGPDLGKRLLFERIVKPFFFWRSYRAAASTVFGATLVLNTGDWLQKYIYYFGLWEPHLTAWITRQLRPGDTFIDVGANIGYFSLLASRIVGETGRVVAIEASPTIAEQLNANVALNRVANVRTINLAVADRKGREPLFSGPDGDSGWTTIIPRDECRLDGYVQADTLTGMLEPHEAQSTRLVKIDVEGAEARVLDGMVSMLWTGRPDLEIVIEVTPARLGQQGRSVKDILDTMARAGFHSYVLQNRYEPASYMTAAAVNAPRRLRTAITRQTDLIFSRQDRDVL